jgi:hypothetical protein
MSVHSGSRSRSTRRRGAGPPDPTRVRPLYYMTPIENVASIAVRGIRSYELASRMRPRPRSVADRSVNARRDDLELEGRPIHSFVPLYWATHTPMQYLVTQKRRTILQSELVFVEVSNDVLDFEGAWMSDGNAAKGKTSFYPQRSGAREVDWEIIDTPNCYSETYRWRKAAEVLVPDRVPPRYFTRICVRTPRARARVRREIDALLRSRVRTPTLVPVAVELSCYYDE